MVRGHDAKLDGRKRPTIRDAGFEHYRVKEYADGTVVLEPRALVSPSALTEETLRSPGARRPIQLFLRACRAPILRRRGLLPSKKVAIYIGIWHREEGPCAGPPESS